MPRNASFVSVGAALLLFAAAACSGSERFVAIGTVATTAAVAPSVRFLSVNNAVGSVQLTPAHSDQVTIRATVSVHASMQAQFPAADLARDLLVTTDPDSVKIQSLHAATSEDAGWKLDLVIEAPPRLHWTIVQAVGAVNVEADNTDVAVSVAVGAIDLTGSARQIELVASTGAARANVAKLAGGTMNAGVGAVQLTVREAGPTDSLDLTTSTGAIEIELPATASADVTLLATMGGIEVQGAPGVKPVNGVLGQRATGSLGDGGPRLMASAGVGGIRLTVRR